MKNSTKVLSAVMLLAIASSAFASGASQTNADMLAIVNQTNEVVQDGSGTGLKLIIAFLPIALFFGMALGTLMHNLKKADQSQDNDYGKIAFWTFLFAFIGGVIGVAIDSFIGAALLKGASCGVEVFQTYWQQAVGIIPKGTNPTYSCN